MFLAHAPSSCPQWHCWWHSSYPLVRIEAKVAPPMPCAIWECIKATSDQHHDWQWSSVFHHMLKEACGEQLNDQVANLGWVCFGPILVEEFRHNTHSHFTPTYCSSQVNKPPPPDDIAWHLHAFWELESLGTTDQAEQATSDSRIESSSCSSSWDITSLLNYKSCYELRRFTRSSLVTSGAGQRETESISAKWIHLRQFAWCHWKIWPS